MFYLVFVVLKEKKKVKKMQTNISGILPEVSIAATIGVGYFLWKNRPVEKNDYYDDFIYLSNSSFPPLLDKFKSFEMEDEFENLTKEIELLLNLSDSIEKKQAPIGSQFQLNRLYHSITNRATLMITKAKSSKNIDVIVSAIDCQRDELDNLLSTCENVLKNTLLNI